MKYLFIAMVAFSLCSCDWAKDKSKKAVNKSGEIAGKAASEFADGVARGVQQSFDSEIVISDQLTKSGLKAGKITFHGTDTTTDNIITAYLVFDGDINQPVTIKVFDEHGAEYGRVRENISGVKGEAKYFDFVFDPRTNIDGKGKIMFE